MCVVGYASRGAVMCGEPVVGFLLCDKERLCGMGWIRLCGSVGLCGGLRAVCRGVALWLHYVVGAALWLRYETMRGCGYAVRIRLCGGNPSVGLHTMATMWLLCGSRGVALWLLCGRVLAVTAYA